MDMQVVDHQMFMGEAFKEALKAYDKGEIPVGAVVVSGEKIIARAHNLTELLNDDRLVEDGSVKDHVSGRPVMLVDVVVGVVL